MKKILTVVMLALAAFIMPALASAQDDPMAQLAKEMNAGITPEDGIASITYEKGKLIFTATDAFLDDDSRALLESVGGNTDFLAPLVKGAVKQSMDEETRSLMSQMLAYFNTVMVYRIPYNGTNVDIVIAASDLQ